MPRAKCTGVSFDLFLSFISFLLLLTYASTFRIVWAMICLAAGTVFTYLIYSKVIHLLSHPKNVNMEVTFTDELDFPAVTVCNENTFR